MHARWHPYLAPHQVEFDLGNAARGDPFGDRVHAWLAAAWCFFVSWPTSIVEIASIPLVVFFLLRTPKIWRTWGSFAVQPLTLAIAAWVLWQALSLAWSPDRSQGLKELAANRWVWVIWVLWPVMRRRPLLIAALAAGFICGNLSQLGHAAGRAWGVEWLTWPRLENRVSGWWDPVVGGSLLVGALGLHLPAAVLGRGRERLIGVGGAAITLAAILATGTRGAWIAAAGLLGLALLMWLAALATRKSRITDRRSGSGLRRAGVLAGVLVAVATGAWLVRGPVISRASEARDELRAAWRGDFGSYTGSRLLMWRAAAELVRERPMTGVGAGGYRAAARAWAERAGDQQGPIPADAIHSHAHSAPLHIAATTGLIGLGLAMMVIILALHGACTGLPPGGLRGYAAGPWTAITGLMLVGLFDPVHLNAQTGALLATLMALCLVSRPAALGPGVLRQAPTAAP
jgi:O-antigen ligase